LLLAALRAADATHETPLLLIGETCDRDRLLRGFEIGASDWLLRPLDANELRVRARNQIRRKFYQEQLRADLGQALSMAVIDPLTGLYNQRYLLCHLHRLLERSPQQAVSVLMIDVDRFKAVNDALGHAAGSDVLATIAETLRGHVRAFDTLARYGGDEFVAVMPGICPDDAVAVAERLRDGVERIKLAGTPRLTVSVGVACTGHGISSAAALLRAADTALYEAKRAGRNRVELAGRWRAAREMSDPAI
jgi:two-component system cell cycle response regulator